VPSGWTRYPFYLRTLSDAAKQGAPDKLSVTTIFKHDSNHRSEFWLPVPTAVEHTAENVLPPQTDLLFTATRAWFYCARDVESSRPGTSLRDKYGKWVGYMNFHDKDAVDALPKFNKALFTGHSLELVAISRGYALLKRGSNNRMGLEEYLKVSGIYEYYNVLWIKWEYGVAYRDGLGRVLKSVWEAQDLETVEVVLG
jgi:hypothetical protein